MALDSEETISLHSLSELTGFPVEMLKDELLLNQKEIIFDDEHISMDNLRTVMFNYLNTTMLTSDK